MNYTLYVIILESNKWEEFHKKWEFCTVVKVLILDRHNCNFWALNNYSIILQIYIFHCERHAGGKIFYMLRYFSEEQFKYFRKLLGRNN